MSLLDTIQNNLKQLSNTQQPGAGINDTTFQAQRLLRGKTGKVVSGGTAPRMSNIGEQAVVDQTRAGLAEVATQSKLQSAQIEQKHEQIDAEAKLQGRQLDEQQLSQMDRFQNQADEIMTQLSQGQRELDLNRDKMKLEYVALNLRLANEKYIENLQLEGQRSRLDSEIFFNEELSKALFDEELEMFRSDMDFRAMMSADDREFNELLFNMDVEHAQRMAKMARDAANQRAIWEGIGTLTSVTASSFGGGSGKDTPGGNYEGEQFMDSGTPTMNQGSGSGMNYSDPGDADNRSFVS